MPVGACRDRMRRSVARCSSPVYQDAPAHRLTHRIGPIQCPNGEMGSSDTPDPADPVPARRSSLGSLRSPVRDHAHQLADVVGVEAAVAAEDGPVAHLVEGVHAALSLA